MFIVHIGEFVVQIRQNGFIVITPGFFVVPLFFFFGSVVKIGIGVFGDIDNPAVAAIVFGVCKIVVWNIAIAVIAPFCAPRIAHNKDLIDIRITDAQHGVTAVTAAGGIVAGRHGNKSLTALSVK